MLLREVYIRLSYSIVALRGLKAPTSHGLGGLRLLGLLLSEFVSRGLDRGLVSKTCDQNQPVRGGKNGSSYRAARRLPQPLIPDPGKSSPQPQIDTESKALGPPACGGISAPKQMSELRAESKSSVYSPRRSPKSKLRPLEQTCNCTELSATIICATVLLGVLIGSNEATSHLLTTLLRLSWKNLSTLTTQGASADFAFLGFS